MLRGCYTVPPGPLAAWFLWAPSFAADLERGAWRLRSAEWHIAGGNDFYTKICTCVSIAVLFMVAEMETTQISINWRRDK